MTDIIKNSDRVLKIIDFIECLIVPSGVGEGKEILLRDFQVAFLHDVYGSERDSRRVVLRAILSIARKNGKTLLIAALVLVHLVGPEAIRNGEIYSAATEREQAGIVFKYAAQLVRADPELGSMIKIVDSTKTMVCMQNGSVYRAISAEAGSKFGYNPSVVIYDELAQAKNRDLYDALDTSMAARLEPLFITISTQSNDPQHILSQLIDDGLSGNDPTTICHLFEVPLDEENIFNSKRIWKLANPALGDFRSLSEMKTAAGRAVRMPTFEAAFRNLYLNQRVDAKSPLIPRQEWLNCKTKLQHNKGDKVYLGLDLSGKTDLTALVGVTDGDKDEVLAWFFKPEESLAEHEKRDRVPYTVWNKLGHIETSPGRAIQYDWVAERIAQINRDYNIIGLAFDRYRIDDLLSALKNIGVETYIEDKDIKRTDAIRMIPWGQGYKDMTPAVEALEISIMARRLAHDGNPVLTWNISNAISISDPAGNQKLDKSKSRFRIDGAVALCMAVGLKSRFLKLEPPKSGYEGMTEEQIAQRINFI